MLEIFKKINNFIIIIISSFLLALQTSFQVDSNWSLIFWNHSFNKSGNATWGIGIRNICHFSLFIIDLNDLVSCTFDSSSHCSFLRTSIIIHRNSCKDMSIVSCLFISCQNHKVSSGDWEYSFVLQILDRVSFSLLQCFLFLKHLIYFFDGGVILKENYHILERSIDLGLSSTSYSVFETKLQRSALMSLIELLPLWVIEIFFKICIRNLYFLTPISLLHDTVIIIISQTY